MKFPAVPMLQALSHHLLAHWWSPVTFTTLSYPPGQSPINSFTLFFKLSKCVRLLGPSFNFFINIFVFWGDVMQSNTSHARYILTLIIAVVIDETGVLSFMFTAGRSLSLCISSVMTLSGFFPLVHTFFSIEKWISFQTYCWFIS